MTSSSDLKRSHRRVPARHRTAVDKAIDEIKNWLIGVAADHPTTVADATNQIVNGMSDAVAAAIVNTLGKNGYRCSRDNHFLCDFLAAIAHTMQEFRDKFEYQVEHTVSTVLASRRVQKRSSIPKPIVHATAQAAVSAIMSLPPARQFDDLLRATRILAIITCPDPTRHRGVVIYCLEPLETFVLSSATKQELMLTLPRGWMSSA